jgi:phosphoribosylformimino-5-aminoimidazole carboxamide ribotide isomerase
VEVIPAIDLIDGRCVRLYQGDYSRETVYSDDPVEVALRWERLGARRIHVVDLDGARAGSPQNLDVISRIADKVRLPVQMGGGVRTIDSVREVIDSGVDRVMLGTVAVRDPGIVTSACERFGAETVLVAIDSRDGNVAVSGWTDGSETSATDLLRLMMDAGVRTFLCTDISRDGTLAGPDYDLMRSLVAIAGNGVIAAGGIASIDHLTRLASIGVGGAVIGRALYTGDIDLAEAVSATGSPGHIC